MTVPVSSSSAVATTLAARLIQGRASAAIGDTTTGLGRGAQAARRERTDLFGSVLGWYQGIPARYLQGRSTSMHCRSISRGKQIAMGTLIIILHAGVAAAQGAMPPPAVTVAPAVTRKVIETGEFIGRVTAIDKVDIVARVPGYIEERNFEEGQQ